MAAFTSSTHTFASPHSFLTHFSTRGFPSCSCLVNQGKKANLVSLKLNLGRGFEFGEAKKERVCCWCKKEGGKDGDFALEAAILEFMTNSEKPETFPSKKELVDAGRMDLVEGIQRQGGWLTMGWDLDDDKDNGCQQNVAKNSDLVVKDNECRNEAFEGRLQSGAESIESEDESRGASSLTSSSSCSPSSSGRSPEVAAEDGYGIEGILSRLERERNISLGFGAREKGYTSTCPQSSDAEEESVLQASVDMTVGDRGTGKLVSSRHGTGLINDNGIKFSRDQSLSGTHLNNSTWRDWSLQRAGFTSKEFDGEEILGVRDKSVELDRRKESHASEKDINHNDIQNRLLHLKSELSSVLHSLRSNFDEVLSQNGDANFTDNLHELSDAWEFQENEIMNAQNKMRSIRAKLAVLEGKMALAIIDTQKILEEKQKRIDDARRALQLLRPACIVWPNSASEVLLAGSFDGWATKRKMEKSSTGVFSVSLKLYPGKYEIKFIVDGEWKIDPLRPTVNSNGFENNLLIIT